MSHDVDRSFERENWESGPFPTQEFPEEVRKLLGALNDCKRPGWLFAESCIRNLGKEGRNDLAEMLSHFRESLNQYPARYFLYGSETSLFVWLQRWGKKIDWKEVNDRASAAALMRSSGAINGLMIEVTAHGDYKVAHTFKIERPAELTRNNALIFEDAERMKKRAKEFALPSGVRATRTPVIGRKPGRNDPCPCGSGLKYKKCHGR